MNDSVTRPACEPAGCSMRGAIFEKSQSSARGNQAPALCIKEKQGASGPLDFLYETRWQAVRASRYRNQATAALIA